MKKALVLGGGGSKGAYEIGVWKALNEMNMSFDIVTGTSIGAMIGVLYVQQQYEKAYDLWDNLQVEQIIRKGLNVDLDIELIMGQKGKYKDFLQSYVQNKGADITPFEELLHDYFDADRFFSSPMDYACMIYNVTKREPLAMSKKDMTVENAVDYILASASCFPAFPMKEINGEKLVDGGFYDNVPIELARSMGAEYIVAVDLKSVGKNQIHHPQEDLIYIEPQVPLGSFLLFDHQRIKRNMTLGYQDTMKVFQHYMGSIYTFDLKDQDLIIRFEDDVHRQMDHIDTILDRDRMNLLIRKAVHHQMISSFSKFKEYDWPFLRMLELIAWEFGIDDIGVKSFPSFLQEVMIIANEHVAVWDKSMRDDWNLSQAISGLKNDTGKEIICSIYRKLCSPNRNVKELEAMVVMANDSFVMAYLLYAIQKVLLGQ